MNGEPDMLNTPPEAGGDGIRPAGRSGGVAVIPACPLCFQAGFTMVELIAVMVIAVVLAALSAQKFFDNNAYDSHGFYEQVAFALRYAQKAAIAQNRYVCVALTASSVTLTVNASATCPGSNLTSPAGDTTSTTYSISAPSSNVTLSGYTTPFYYDAKGKPYNNGDVPPTSTFVKQTITVKGYTTPLYVETETGYVH